MYNKEKERRKIQSWRKRNPEKVKAQKQRYNEKNPHKIKEKHRRYRIKHKEKIKLYRIRTNYLKMGIINSGTTMEEVAKIHDSRKKEYDLISEFQKTHKQEYRILHKIRKSAQKRKREFNLTIEDIVIPEVCPYLKTPFTKDDTKYCLSVDRIDSTKGYIKGNVQFISKLANQMKSCATPEELVNFCRTVLERLA